MVSFNDVKKAIEGCFILVKYDETGCRFPVKKVNSNLTVQECAEYISGYAPPIDGCWVINGRRVDASLTLKDICTIEEWDMDVPLLLQYIVKFVAY